MSIGSTASSPPMCMDFSIIIFVSLRLQLFFRSVDMRPLRGWQDTSLLGVHSRCSDFLQMCVSSTIVSPPFYQSKSVCLLFLQSLIDLATSQKKVYTTLGACHYVPFFIDGVSGWSQQARHSGSLVRFGDSCISLLGNHVLACSSMWGWKVGNIFAKIYSFMTNGSDALKI